MIVISDTSPINYLILTGEIDILEKLFRRIVVPQAVFSELQHTKTPQRVKDWIANAPSWLEVKQADASLFTPSKRIGNGEREAIALAIELKADAVLIDDRDGTQEARRQSLIAVGTVNLLERAAEKGLLDLPESLDRLGQTSFRMPPNEIIDAMLERDRKRKSRN
jgi:predicted nucleic acid-binding protein